MIPLRQSTASQEIPLGYFVDSTDGDSEEASLTIANTDIKLWKAGATTLANKNSGGATHISNGIYYTTLDATDTNTLGSLIIFCHVAGALTVRLECVVLPANVYDSLIAGTDVLTADVTQWLGTAAATPTTAGVPEVDVTFVGGQAATAAAGVDFDDLTTLEARLSAARAGYLDELGPTNVPADVDTLLGRLSAARAGYLDELAAANIPADVDTLLARIVGTLAAGTHNPQTGDSFARIGATGSGLTSLAPASLFSGMTSMTEWLGLLAGSQVGDATARTEIRATGAGSGTYDETTDSQQAIRDSGGGGPTAADIADAVWDEAVSGHVGVGSFGEEVQAHALSSEISALNDIAAADVWAVATRVLTANTNLNDPTAADIADAVWDELIAAHVGVGSFGEEVQAHALSSEISALNDIAAADVWAAVTRTITGTAAGALTANSFSAGAIDAAALAADAVAEIADGVLDEVVEGSYTLRQYARGWSAALLGKASGLATTTALYRDTGDTVNRINATVDADGNRSAVTLTLT